MTTTATTQQAPEIPQGFELATNDTIKPGYLYWNNRTASWNPVNSLHDHLTLDHQAQSLFNTLYVRPKAPEIYKPKTTMEAW